VKALAITAVLISLGSAPPDQSTMTIIHDAARSAFYAQHISEHGIKEELTGHVKDQARHWQGHTDMNPQR
jgi:2-C-methyl-D-erythritol 4-phosphate cytidylyltransferase